MTPEVPEVVPTTVRVVAFTVDAAYKTADTFLDLPVVAFEEVAAAYPPGTHSMFVALSYAKMNQLQAEVHRQVVA